MGISPKLIQNSTIIEPKIILDPTNMLPVSIIPGTQLVSSRFIKLQLVGFISSKYENKMQFVMLMKLN